MTWLFVKIEDIATIPSKITDAEICLSDDKDYDYDLTLFSDSEIEDKNSIVVFIETTAKNEKVLNGKIHYSFTVGKSKNRIREIKA